MEWSPNVTVLVVIGAWSHTPAERAAARAHLDAHLATIKGPILVFTGGDYFSTSNPATEEGAPIVVQAVDHILATREGSKHVAFPHASSVVEGHSYPEVTLLATHDTTNADGSPCFTGVVDGAPVGALREQMRFLRGMGRVGRLSVCVLGGGQTSLVETQWFEGNLFELAMQGRARQVDMTVYGLGGKEPGMPFAWAFARKARGWLRAGVRVVDSEGG